MNRLEKLHNDEYQDLKSRGFSGWGAESLEKRIEGFSRIIKLLEGTSEWIKPPARILDIGCGAGQLTLMLAERKYSMTGVDFSSTAIEMAEHNFKKHGYSGEFLCTEIQNIMELNLEPYDAVFDLSLIHI